MAELKTAFKSIKRKALPNQQGVSGLPYLDNVSAMQVGYGSEGFRVDKSGLWLGANRFADAPFKVAMDGSLEITGPSNSTLLTDQVLVFYNSGVPVIVIGDPSTV